MHAQYYAQSIVSVESFPVDHPIDRDLWIGVAEYVFVVLAVIALVFLIAEDLASPLWGGLTSIRLR